MDEKKIAIAPVERPYPINSDENIRLLDNEADGLIQIQKAKRKFNLSGQGMTVAIIDTGILYTHADFSNSFIKANESDQIVMVNFTADNNSDQFDAKDGHGHGSNVAGIIAANGIHKGIAQNAKIIPLKVLDNLTGSGEFSSAHKALQWVVDNQEKYNIDAVCLAFGDDRNEISDSNYSTFAFLNKYLNPLLEKNIPIIVAAGNSFKSKQCQEGMCYPALFRNTVSVGGVFGGNIGNNITGPDDTIAYKTTEGQILPFSQRTSQDKDENCFTKAFAPGAHIKSTGISSNNSSATFIGTSQAAAVVTGSILLVQEYYKRNNNNQKPTVGQIMTWFGQGATSIYDGDNEFDNVQPTKSYYLLINILSTINAINSPKLNFKNMTMLTDLNYRPTLYLRNINSYELYIHLNLPANKDASITNYSVISGGVRTVTITASDSAGKDYSITPKLLYLELLYSQVDPGQEEKIKVTIHNPITGYDQTAIVHHVDADNHGEWEDPGRKR